MSLYRVYCDDGKTGEFDFMNSYRNFEQLEIWSPRFRFEHNDYKADVICPYCKAVIQVNLEKDEHVCPECENWFKLWDVEDEL